MQRYGGDHEIGCLGAGSFPAPYENALLQNQGLWVNRQVLYKQILSQHMISRAIVSFLLVQPLYALKTH